MDFANQATRDPATGRARSLAGGTAAGTALRPVLVYARTRGVDVEALRLELGLPASALDDPEYRLSERTSARVWQEAAARSGDPAFALHVVEHSAVGAFDVLDFALWCSATLRELIDRTVRFHRVLCDSLAPVLDVRGSVARLRLQGDPEPHSAEALFALIVVRARELAAAGFAPREVKFAHPAPLDPSPYVTLFACPVRFGSAASELVLDASALRLPLRTACPGLAVVLDRYMTRIVSRLPSSTSFTDRVRKVVGETLQAEQRPTLRSTAKALKASQRTVQRRLLGEGTTHRRVVDAIRKDMGLRLMELPHLSVTEISFRLGFSGTSAFRRRFKRWTGRTPTLARIAND
jgi:AraC-like DNA-binding protein